MLLLVRVLSIEEFGIYMLLVGLAEMMVQVASFGIPPVGYRYLPQLVTTASHRSIARFLAALVVMQLVILTVVCLLLDAYWEPVAATLGIADEMMGVARAGILLFLLIPSFRFVVILLESLLEQGRAQLARALMPIGRALVLVLLLAGSQTIDLETVLIVDIVVTGATLLLGWYQLARGIAPYRDNEADAPLPVGEMVNFGWHMASVDLAAATSAPGALRAVLANTLGIAEVALFAFLQSLQRLVGRYLPGVLLRGLVRPMLVDRQTRGQGPGPLTDGSGLLFKLNITMVALGCIVLAAGGDTLVGLLSGGKFTDAGWLLMLMFVGLGATSQKSVLEMLMQLTGQTAALRAASILGPAALLVVWLYSDLGLGVAVSIVVLASIATTAIATVIVHRRTSVEIDYRGIANIVLAGVAAAAMGAALNEWVSIVVAGLASLSAFALFLWHLRPFTTGELRLIERVLGRSFASIVQKPAASG